TAGPPLATIDSRVTSAALVGEPELLAGLGIAWVVLPADQLDRSWRAACPLGDQRGGLLVRSESLERSADRWQPHDRGLDPAHPGRPQRIHDPRHDAGVALARIMQEPGEEHVGIAEARASEHLDDIEPVATVGDVHRIEDVKLLGRQPAGERA